MTPWSIASGLCVGDTKGLYYVRPDIARIALFVDFNEVFRLPLVMFAKRLRAADLAAMEAANIPSGFRSCGNSKGRGSTAAKIGLFEATVLHARRPAEASDGFGTLSRHRPAIRLLHKELHEPRGM